MTIQDTSANSVTVWQPRSLEAAWTIKRQLGARACFIAGGTWMQAQWQSGEDKPNHLISLERIDDLREIKEKQIDGGICLELGALTTIRMCKEHPSVLQNWPMLSFACGEIAAPAVRNRATLGGNIMSRFGDTLPALLALDAELISFHEGQHTTSLPVSRFIEDDSFMEGEAAALLSGVRLYQAAPQTPFASPSKTGCASQTQTVSLFRKVSRREAFAPSLVTIAALCSFSVGCLEQHHNLCNNAGTKGHGIHPGDHHLTHHITHIRIAVGGADFPARRLVDCEKLLLGSAPSSEVWKAFHAEVLREFHPPSNTFTSGEYRRVVAANVLSAGLSQGYNRLKGEGEHVADT